MDAQVDKLSKRYIKQELFLVVGLFLCCMLTMRIWLLEQVFQPALVSLGFCLLTGIATALVWKYVAKNAPDSLTTFYTSVSGFRMLLALILIFVYYLVADRAALGVFFIVFAVFYLTSLLHHVVFFAKIVNHS